jgi:hypothetical protein
METLVDVLGKIPKPTPAMAVALLALIIAASGAAVAAIPGSDGTITACRDNKDGELRAIDAEGGQRCGSKETQLVWKDGITGKVADSEKLDGLDSTEFAKAYKRTVIVSPVGTDTENGQALLDALKGITDASASKPYLLYIEPGTYDLGWDTLQMKEHVDIQGSGELNTIISGGVPTSCFTGGTVTTADNTELRFLTVQNTSATNATTDCGVAIFSSSDSARLTHVTAKATTLGRGTHYGLHIFGSPTLTNVTATASRAAEINVGVLVSTPSGSGPGSDPTMTNLTATASEGSITLGLYIRGTGSATVRESTLSGRDDPFGLDDTATLRIASTQLVGGFDVEDPEASGNVRCFNNYDQNMAAVTCQ